MSKHLKIHMKQASIYLHNTGHAYLYDRFYNDMGLFSVLQVSSILSICSEADHLYNWSKHCFHITKPIDVNQKQQTVFLYKNTCCFYINMSMRKFLEHANTKNSYTRCTKSSYIALSTES